jgi:hypothetical protein
MFQVTTGTELIAMSRVRRKKWEGANKENGPYFLSLFGRAPSGTNKVLLSPDNVSPAGMDQDMSTRNLQSQKREILSVENKILRASSSGSDQICG